MKKLIVLSASAFFLTLAGNTQQSITTLNNEKKELKWEDKETRKEEKETRKELRKQEGKEASYQSQEAFYSDFGNVQVISTERTTYFDEITFKKDNQVMKAFYDENFRLVGTTENKNFDDLPLKAQKFIDEKYSGYSKESVLLFDDNELNETDMILFGTQFEDADNYFIELQKDQRKIILQVSMSGDVNYFMQL